MNDDETTQEPEASSDDDARQDKAAVDAPEAGGTVDPNAAKVGHVTPKPHVRE
jgi:hypothetical protein